MLRPPVLVRLNLFNVHGRSKLTVLYERAFRRKKWGCTQTFLRTFPFAYQTLIVCTYHANNFLPSITCKIRRGEAAPSALKLRPGPLWSSPGGTAAVVDSGLATLKFVRILVGLAEERPRHKLLGFLYKPVEAPLCDVLPSAVHSSWAGPSSCSW